MSYQDWTPVVLNSGAKGPSSKKDDVNRAMKTDSGSVQSVQKHGAGKNAAHGSSQLREDEDGMVKLTYVSKEQAQAIISGRSEKKLTRKELAQRINEKETVVADYETCKAIPNQQILAKMERQLGLKLRGKDVGQPLHAGKK